MSTKWSDYREEAISLRVNGVSLSVISSQLGVPRSTLSGRLKDVAVDPQHLAMARKRQNESLAIARLKANQWHRKQKTIRLIKAKDDAATTINNLTKDDSTQELALAMLYYGVGAKGQTTSLGSTDSTMLRFFITTVEQLYGLDKRKFRYDLHLRHDQDATLHKKIWASKLGIDVVCFGYVSIDKRTIGSPTKPDHIGTCQINIGNIAIQRKLKELYTLYCREVTGT